MKKSICLSVVFLLAFSYYGAAQCCLRSKSKDSKSKLEAKTKSPSKSFSKSVSNAKWIPYLESSVQLGLCGDDNTAIGFTGGAERKVSKQLTIAGDIQYWGYDYEMWCDDMHSNLKYTSVIPSVKFKYDPGKQFRGIFVGAGIGYAVVTDRGTEQLYTTNLASGVKSTQGAATPVDYDFKTIAPSFSWGFSMKVNRYPVTVLNTNYFGKSTQGWQGISSGVGLRIGLSKLPKEKSCGSAYRIRIVEKSVYQKTKSSQQKSKSNSSQRSGCTPKIKI